MNYLMYSVLVHLIYKGIFFFFFWGGGGFFITEVVILVFKTFYQKASKSFHRNAYF